MSAEQHVPRFMTHCAASRPKFNDPGVRRDVKPIDPCLLKDQASDLKVPRSVTPQREAMWRNFGGSQAAAATGHAGKAFDGETRPKIRPKTIAESLQLTNTSTTSSNNNNRASTPQPRGELSHTRSVFQQKPVESITKKHWTNAETKSTALVPVEKNSSAISGGRADSVVRSAPFPHHKNMVLPSEDPTVDTNPSRLWMDRPLRNGQRVAPAKRHYQIPGFFRSSEEIMPEQDKHRPIKKKLPQEVHLEGASANVIEPVAQEKMSHRPLVERVFNPPYNETERVDGRVVQEVPRAARVLGKAHLPAPQPERIVKDMLPGWSGQPDTPRTGRRFSDANLRTSEDFRCVRTDTPPKPSELPRQRSAVAVRPGGGPAAFVPQPSPMTGAGLSPFRNAPVVAAAVNNTNNNISSRGNSPSRRAMFAPVDNDIFGTRQLLKPWQPVPQGRSLSPAPGAVDVHRCKGVGQFSPARVTPKYSF